MEETRQHGSPCCSRQPPRQVRRAETFTRQYHWKPDEPDKREGIVSQGKTGLDCKGGVAYGLEAGSVLGAGGVDSNVKNGMIFGCTSTHFQRSVDDLADGFDGSGEVEGSGGYGSGNGSGGQKSSDDLELHVE